MRRMTWGNRLWDTSTPVCLDNWDQWKCLKWSFRGTAGQVVHIISLLGILVYFCLTSFWHWWSRRWKTSDRYSGFFLHCQVIWLESWPKLTFFPNGKVLFLFFPFQMGMENAWERNSQNKTHFRSVKTPSFDKYGLLIDWF